eukprot:5114191-Lingulodinium_polyedra.AAC.1
MCHGGLDHQLERDKTLGGGHVQWHAAITWPGRMPNTHNPGVEPVATHVLRCRNAPAALARLRGAANYESGRGTDALE